MNNHSTEGTLIGKRYNDSRSIPTPKGKVVTAEWIESTLLNHLKHKVSNYPTPRIADNDYYLPTQDELAFLLKQSHLDRLEWQKERFDCDDFAYALKGEISIHGFKANKLVAGFAVGIIWGNFDWADSIPHAVNWFIDSSGKLFFIEPQHDDIYEHTECSGSDLILL